jgi:HAD superfamily hydrolase (TIGR01490 family)
MGQTGRMVKSAFVDVDGTLITGTTCERQLLHHLFTSGRISWTGLSFFIISSLPSLLSGRLDALRSNKLYWRGLKEKDMESTLPELYEKRLECRLLGAMIEELDRLRAEGITLVLVSGTPVPLLEELGKRLGIDVLVGTRLEVKRGTYTGRVDGIHPYGRRKLQALDEAGLLDRFDLGQSTAYGNSWPDRFLLERVGFPVVVRPDNRLAALARQRGWRILTG